MWKYKTTKYYEDKLQEVRHFADLLDTLENIDASWIADKLRQIVGEDQ